MHTPGPWTAWDDDGTGTLPCVLAKQVTSAGNFYVAQCNVYDDARLIAASPDLLAVCKEIADDSRVDLIDSERRIRMYAAIQKAGG